MILNLKLERIEQRIPQNTRQATEWCLSVWQEWAEERNCLLAKKVLLLIIAWSNLTVVCLSKQIK